MNTERELRRLIRKSMREFKRTQTTCIEPGCKTITLHDRCDRHRVHADADALQRNRAGPSAAFDNAGQKTAKSATFSPRRIG
jgi:hypothetical protein